MLLEANRLVKLLDQGRKLLEGLILICLVDALDIKVAVKLLDLSLSLSVLLSVACLIDIG